MRCIQALVAMAACIFGSACHSASLDCAKNLSEQINSSWTLKEFDVGGKKNTNFSPIREIVFDKGNMYVMTWGGELFQTGYRLKNGSIVFQPTYLAPINIGPELGKAASLVQPFSSNDVVHEIELDTRCLATDELRVSIFRMLNRRKVDMGHVVLAKHAKKLRKVERNKPA